jgi:hypothetical protein
MTNPPDAPTPILYDEAGALTESIGDERLRAFVNYGLTTVLVRRGMDPAITLEKDFDLRFFAEVLRAMGADRAALLRILEGDIADAEWWPGDA